MLWSERSSLAGSSPLEMVVVHGLKDVSNDDDGPDGVGGGMAGVPREAMERIDGEKQSKQGPGGLCVSSRVLLPPALSSRAAARPCRRCVRLRSSPGTTRSRSARSAPSTR